MSPSDNVQADEPRDRVVTRSSRRLRELEAEMATNAPATTTPEQSSAMRIDYLQRRIAQLESEISRQATNSSAPAQEARTFGQERLQVESLVNNETHGNFGRSFRMPPTGRNLEFQGLQVQRSETARLTIRDLKLSIQPFDGEEIYPGLGSGFDEWGWKFVREINLVQQLSGITWNEDLKVDRLGHYLKGTALAYYAKRATIWWNEQPALWYTLDKMSEAFRSNMTRAKANKLFMQKKDPRKTWTQHYLYLVALGDAIGGADAQVLESIVYYVNPELKTVMCAKMDARRADCNRTQLLHLILIY